MDNWVKTTQRRLTDEPYPRSSYHCEKCGQGWDDTEDAKCVCIYGEHNEEEELLEGFDEV